MSKYFKYYLSIWAILFAVFNVAVFATPSEVAGMSKFGGAFWSGYVFITLAFFGQAVSSYFAFKSENSQKFFYKIPLVRVSYTGLVLTVVFGTLCMAVPNLPNWVGIVICFAVLAFTAVAVIKAEVAAEIVGETDEKIKVKTVFVKTLAVDAETLMNKAPTGEIKTECKKVYEAVRYSDPMSNEALSSSESQITVKFAEFTAAVNGNDIETVKKTANEVIILLDDRNKKCRLLK